MRKWLARHADTITVGIVYVAIVAAFFLIVFWYGRPMLW